MSKNLLYRTALLVGTCSIPVAGWAFEPQTVVEGWQQYQAICGRLMNDGEAAHNDPLTLLELQPGGDVEWTMSPDGAVSSLGFQSVTATGKNMFVVIESMRTDKAVSQYCLVNLTDNWSDIEDSDSAFKEIFANGGLTVHGGPMVPKADGPLEDEVAAQYALQGAFTDNPVVTSISISPGGLAFEHTLHIDRGI